MTGLIAFYWKSFYKYLMIPKAMKLACPTGTIYRYPNYQALSNIQSERKLSPSSTEDH
jgi:hypothetical protein